jgi:hypothetical protein
MALDGPWPVMAGGRAKGVSTVLLVTCATPGSSLPPAQRRWWVPWLEGQCTLAPPAGMARPWMLPALSCTQQLAATGTSASTLRLHRSGFEAGEHSYLGYRHGRNLPRMPSACSCDASTASSRRQETE